MFDSVYIDVFRDSFFAYFIGTLDGEFAFPTLLMYGKHSGIVAAATACLASTLALTANYFIFFLVAKLLKKQLDSNPGFPAVKHYVNKFSPAIGALGILQDFSLIPVFFFGVTQLNFKKFLIIIVFYRVVYYIYMLNTTHVLFS
jgi:membrane protein YqaA with SNARE-associated domain